MAIACLLEFTGVHTEQIDQLLNLLDLQKKLQTGSAVFGAGEDGGKLIVITVWETRPAMELFLESCLSQAVARAGLHFPMTKLWDVDGHTKTSTESLKLEWKERLVLNNKDVHAKN